MTDGREAIIRLTEEAVKALQPNLDALRIRLPDLQRHVAPVLPVLEKAQAASAQLQREWTSSIQPVIQQMNRIAPDLVRQVRKAWTRAMPSNWRVLDGTEVTQVVRLMETRGWCLAWNPSDEILREMLAADDPGQTMLDRASDIATGMEDCLSDLSSRDHREEINAAREAIGCFHDGRVRAAQALAAATLTSLVHEALGFTGLGRARSEFLRRDPENGALSLYRLTAVLRSVGSALRNYSGTPPQEFNRHASLHSVSQVQYTPRNAIAALLAVVGLLRELAVWPLKAE